MSFCTERKNEIISQGEKNLCCRRAMLLGALAFKAECVGDTISLQIGDGDVAAYLSSLVLEIYGKTAELTVPKSGGRCKIITFESKSASKYIRGLDKTNFLQAKCTACISAFLRGVFLAIGRVSDPRKQHSLEFSPLESRIELMREIFGFYDLSLSVAVRSGGVGLYTKRSDTVEDFFGAAGMNDAFFSLVHLKISKESRNASTRVSNCEMSNIRKAVDAAARQLKLLDELERRDLLSSLPEELYNTARLRLTYRDMSLSQLALTATPPISKSGLSHRLKRLTELAEEIIKKSEIL